MDRRRPLVEEIIERIKERDRAEEERKCIELEKIEEELSRWDDYGGD